MQVWNRFLACESLTIAAALYKKQKWVDLPIQLALRREILHLHFNTFFRRIRPCIIAFRSRVSLWSPCSSLTPTWERYERDEGTAGTHYRPGAVVRCRSATAPNVVAVCSLPLRAIPPRERKGKPGAFHFAIINASQRSKPQMFLAEYPQYQIVDSGCFVIVWNILSR